jgi:hypothetical protein
MAGVEAEIGDLVSGTRRQASQTPMIAHPVYPMKTNIQPKCRGSHTKREKAMMAP